MQCSMTRGLLATICLATASANWLHTGEAENSLGFVEELDVGKLVKVQAEDNYSSAGLLKAGFYGFKGCDDVKERGKACEGGQHVTGSPGIQDLAACWAAVRDQCDGDIRFDFNAAQSICRCTRNNCKTTVEDQNSNVYEMCKACPSVHTRDKVCQAKAHVKGSPGIRDPTQCLERVLQDCPESRFFAFKASDKSCICGAKTEPICKDWEVSRGFDIYATCELKREVEKVYEWKLFLRQTFPKTFEDEEWRKNPRNPKARNFAMLDELEGFRQNGAFTFKLSWPKSGLKDQIWKQTSNPVTGDGEVTGYEAIDVPYTGNGWGGLRHGKGKALLDGSVDLDERYWYYAVGAFRPWKGGFPGPNDAVQQTELWVRMPADQVCMAPLTSEGFKVTEVALERNIFEVSVQCDTSAGFEGTGRAEPCEGGRDVRYHLKGCYGKGEERSEGCHGSCETCTGPARTQCSSCSGKRFLAVSSCVYQCPSGTWPVEDQENGNICASSTTTTTTEEPEELERPWIIMHGLNWTISPGQTCGAEFSLGHDRGGKTSEKCTRLCAKDSDCTAVSTIRRGNHIEKCRLFSGCEDLEAESDANTYVRVPTTTTTTRFKWIEIGPGKCADSTGLSVRGVASSLTTQTSTTTVPLEWEYLVKPTSLDLIAILKGPKTKSGKTEISVFSSSSSYRSRTSRLVTALNYTHGPGWQFSFKGNGDLVAIQTGQTKSKKIEVTTLSFASKYQNLTRAITPLGWLRKANHRFLVNLKGDLVCLLLGPRTGSGKTELHVLSAESKYRRWVAHRATGLHYTADGRWQFGMSLAGDLVTVMHKAPTGTKMTEVHILGKSHGYRHFIRHDGTAHELTDSKPTVRFVVAGTGDLLAVHPGPVEGPPGRPEMVYTLSFASTYKEFVLATPGKGASASRAYKGQPAANAFDGDLGTYWNGCCKGYPTQTLSYSFSEPKHVTAYGITTFSGECPAAWVLEGSFDGKTFSKLDERTNEGCHDWVEKVYRLPFGSTQLVFQWKFSKGVGGNSNGMVLRGVRLFTDKKDMTAAEEQCDFESILNPPEQDRTYSSVWANNPRGQGHARSALDSFQAWSARRNQPGKEWLQMDLKRAQVISGVVTQSRAEGTPWSNQRVPKYAVHVSLDGRKWTHVGDFKGNADSVYKSKAAFPSPRKARFVRIIPLGFVAHMSMRAGVLACMSLPEDSIVWNLDFEDQSADSGYKGDLIDKVYRFKQDELVADVTGVSHTRRYAHGFLCNGEAGCNEKFSLTFTGLQEKQICKFRYFGFQDKPIGSNCRYSFFANDVEKAKSIEGKCSSVDECVPNAEGEAQADSEGNLVFRWQRHSGGHMVLSGFQLACVPLGSRISETCYARRPLVADEGPGVGDLKSVDSFDDCTQMCTSISGCDSFAMCTGGMNCHFKKKVVTPTEASNPDQNRQNDCGTWYKVKCPKVLETTTTTTTTTTLGLVVKDLTSCFNHCEGDRCDAVSFNERTNECHMYDAPPLGYGNYIDESDVTCYTKAPLGWSEYKLSPSKKWDERCAGGEEKCDIEGGKNFRKLCLEWCADDNATKFCSVDISGRKKPCCRRGPSCEELEAAGREYRIFKHKDHYVGMPCDDGNKCFVLSWKFNVLGQFPKDTATESCRDGCDSTDCHGFSLQSNIDNPDDDTHLSCFLYKENAPKNTRCSFDPLNRNDCAVRTEHGEFWVNLHVQKEYNVIGYDQTFQRVAPEVEEMASVPAWGKASMSSTYSEETEAQNCQDRKPDTRCITAWAGGRGELDPWWQVDIGKAERIVKVKIQAAPDSCDSLEKFVNSSCSLKGAFVGVSKRPCAGNRCDGELCGTVTENDQSSDGNYEISCGVAPDYPEGRYVYVQHKGNRNLHFWEFTAYKVAMAVPAKGTPSISSVEEGAIADYCSDDDFTTRCSTKWNQGRGEANPWYQVDLHAMTAIDKIQLWAKPESCEALGGYSGQHCSLYGAVFGLSLSPCKDGFCDGYICGNLTKISYKEDWYEVSCGGMAGRYVYLQLMGKRVLNFYELIPFKDITAASARGFPTMSSIFGNHFARYCTDGRQETRCSTDWKAAHGEKNPWFQIDLGSSKPIKFLQVLKSDSCVAMRGLSGLHCNHAGAVLGVSETPCEGESCTGKTCGKPYKHSDQPWYGADCAGIAGRYVYVQLPGTRVLNLKEFLVFESKDPYAKYRDVTKIFPWNHLEQEALERKTFRNPWKMVMKQDLRGGFHGNKYAWTFQVHNYDKVMHYVASDGETHFKYSILSEVGELKMKSGKFKFKLEFVHTTGTAFAVWEQESNPFDPSSKCADLEKQQPDFERSKLIKGFKKDCPECVIPDDWSDFQGLYRICNVKKKGYCRGFSECPFDAAAGGGPSQKESGSPTAFLKYAVGITGADTMRMYKDGMPYATETKLFAWHEKYADYWKSRAKARKEAEQLKSVMIAQQCNGTRLPCRGEDDKPCELAGGDCYNVFHGCGGTYTQCQVTKISKSVSACKNGPQCYPHCSGRLLDGDRCEDHAPMDCQGGYVIQWKGRTAKKIGTAVGKRCEINAQDPRKCREKQDDIGCVAILTEDEEETYFK